MVESRGTIETSSMIIKSYIASTQLISGEEPSMEIENVEWMHFVEKCCRTTLSHTIHKKNKGGAKEHIQCHRSVYSCRDSIVCHFL